MKDRLGSHWEAGWSLGSSFWLDFSLVLKWRWGDLEIPIVPLCEFLYFREGG